MKKVLSLFLTLILAMGISGNVLAYTPTSEGVSAYEEILNSINKEFNLELGYVPVNEDEITLKEYEEFTLKIAKQQREALDHIAMLKAEDKINNLIGLSDYYVTPRATKTVPVKHLEKYFNITADYDIIANVKVGNIRNARLGQTWHSTVTNTYITNLSAPTYDYVNGGRDGYISYTGSVHFNGNISYTNYTLYAIFMI